MPPALNSVDSKRISPEINWQSYLESVLSPCVNSKMKYTLIAEILCSENGYNPYDYTKKVLQTELQHLSL